jgi:hypothetical protein
VRLKIAMANYLSSMSLKPTLQAYMMKSRRDGMTASAGIRAFSHCDIYKSVEH